MTNASTIAARYGVREDNNIADAAYDSSAVDYSAGIFDLSDRRLVRIDRIRLLTDRGYPRFDISYVWGTLADGRKVQVSLGVHDLPRKGYKRELVELAKGAGRFAKGLGMLDDMVISILWP